MWTTEKGPCPGQAASHCITESVRQDTIEYMNRII